MGAAEQIAYDHVQKYAYAISEQGVLNVIDWNDPSNPQVNSALAYDFQGAKLTDIEICAEKGLMFIGSGASDKTQPGTVHVLSTVDRSSPAAPMSRGSLTAGPLPDMILPNSDCTKLAVGNEGEGDYDTSLVDPAGSVMIFENSDWTDLTSTVKHTVTLDSYTDAELMANGVHLPLPLDAMAYWDDQNLEPEYLAWSADDSTLFVNLQENNAIATITVPTSGAPSLASITGLGLKDHSSVPLDINKGDKTCNLATYTGLKSLRLPDSIQAVQVDGKTYILTANEGDDKDYGDWEEKLKLKDLVDSDGTPDSDMLGMTISADAASAALADSKIRETLEEMAAECSDGGDGRPGACPLGQTVDDRSEKDGAGTEAIVAGQACGSLMAVTATEKSSTVFVYDISHIDSPSLLFVKHLSPASETKNPGVAYADRSLGEIDPEAMIFLDDAHSPSGKAGVMFGGAWSGTMSFWEFECPSTSESSGASGASLVAFLALVISDGTLWFFTSSKSAKIPFPFPYQNFVEVMLWLFTLMTPMVINGIVFEQLTHDPPRLPRVLTIEREDRRSIPFDLRSAEDLPLVSLQVSLNTRLLAFGVIPTEEPEEEGEHPQKVAEKADVIQALPADDLAVTAVQFEDGEEVTCINCAVTSHALHGWLAESRLRALPKRSIAGLCSSCRKPLPQEAFTRGARRRLRSGAAAACEACNKEARRGRNRWQGVSWIAGFLDGWVSAESPPWRPKRCAWWEKDPRIGGLGGLDPRGSTAWSRCVDDAWVRSFAHLRRGAFTTDAAGEARHQRFALPSAPWSGRSSAPKVESVVLV
eukprot:g30500.t1